MRDKAVQYTHAALTATGFAIVDPGIAFQLRPDLWATAFNCGADFSTDAEPLKHIAERRGAQLYAANLQGVDKPVAVLAMSLDQIQPRVLWITGRRLKSIAPWEQATDADAGPRHEVPEYVNGERVPDYACAHRRKLLEQAGITRDPLEERVP